MDSKELMDELLSPRPKGDGPEFEWMIPGMEPLEQMTRRLEAIADEGGWDQKPCFYTFSLIGDVSTIDLEELQAQADAGKEFVGGLAISELQLPEFCYEDPGGGLGAFVHFLGEGAEEAKSNGPEARKLFVKFLNAIVPVNFHGLAVVTEAWALPPSVSDEERRRHSHDHTMHLHPDRMELRTATVGTRDGRMAALARLRGEVPDYCEIDMSTGEAMYGRVPDAMRRLIMLFEGFDRWRKPFIAESLKADHGDE